jgi:PAS domain S-box-containing protein
LEVKEKKFNDNEMIVSMTDAKGIITYANDIFCKMAEYDLEEVIGKPHNMLRHPDMPKVVFKLVWKNLLAGRNFYGFIKNKTKNGNYYWVKAFFQPIIKNGRVDKLISYRQSVNDYTKEIISPIYKQLLDIESKESIVGSEKFLNDFLNKRNLSYMEFIDRLSVGKSITNPAVFDINYESFYNDHIIFKEHIKHQCELKNFDVKVTDSCCCRFGKWLDSVKNEDYTNHPSWKNIHYAHDDVHNKLKEYVSSMKNSNSTLSNKLLEDIEQDTEKIFDNLQKVIDESR